MEGAGRTHVPYNPVRTELANFLEAANAMSYGITSGGARDVAPPPQRPTRPRTLKRGRQESLSRFRLRQEQQLDRATKAAAAKRATRLVNAIDNSTKIREHEKAQLVNAINNSTRIRDHERA
jgi:hypothetical protein